MGWNKGKVWKGGFKMLREGFISILFIFGKLFKYLTELYFSLLFRNPDLSVGKNFELFVFSRNDRIGDAIVTLPFLLALKKKGIEFKVLSSKENDWVLRPFVKTQVVENRELSLLKKIFLLILGIFFGILRRRNAKKSRLKVFFDLKGDYFLSRFFSKREYFCVHCKNLLLNTLHSDYVLDDFYSSFGKKQLIEKYLSFFEKMGVSLDIEEFPEEIEKFIRKNHNSEIDKLLEELDNFIIVFVGNKKFRNFDPIQWKEIIEKGIIYEGNILVVDDPSKRNLSFLERTLQGNNVLFLEKTYSLWDLMYLAIFSKWVVGVDGGGFNFLQMPTNAFEILFYTDVHTWKPYSNNKYILERRFTNNVCLISSETSQRKVKKVLFVNDDEKVLYEKLELENRNIKEKLVETILQYKIKLD